MKTKTVKVSDKKAVSLAASVLRKGGLVIIPTETSYGVAADACSETAVARVYKLKKRLREKALPVIVANIAMACRFFSLDKTALKLCRFFPAPLTLIVKKKAGLASNISRNGTIAFRIPDHWFCRRLSAELGRPITATSANISGKQQVFSSQQIKKLFAGKVELIVDAGALRRRKSSTIINCAGSGIQVVRRGAFPLRRASL